jgi:hypothetical protein
MQYIVTCDHRGRNLKPIEVEALSPILAAEAGERAAAKRYAEENNVKVVLDDFFAWKVEPNDTDTKETSSYFIRGITPGTTC